MLHYTGMLWPRHSAALARFYNEGMAAGYRKRSGGFKTSTTAKQTPNGRPSRCKRDALPFGLRTPCGRTGLRCTPVAAVKVPFGRARAICAHV